MIENSTLINYQVDPSFIVTHGSIQKFEIVESISRDVESETYEGQIVFTDDLFPDSSGYVNSMKLSITVQAQPEIELQTTYLSYNYRNFIRDL